MNQETTKKYFEYIIYTIFFIVCTNLVWTIITTREEINNLYFDKEDLGNKIEKLKKEKNELASNLTKIGSMEVQEKMARDILIMVKKGEVVYREYNLNNKE